MSNIDDVLIFNDFQWDSDGYHRKEPG